MSDWLEAMDIRYYLDVGKSQFCVKAALVSITIN